MPLVTMIRSCYRRLLPVRPSDGRLVILRSTGLSIFGGGRTRSLLEGLRLANEVSECTDAVARQSRTRRSRLSCCSSRSCCSLNLPTTKEDNPSNCVFLGVGCQLLTGDMKGSADKNPSLRAEWRCAMPRLRGIVGKSEVGCAVVRIGKMPNIPEPLA